MTAKAFLFKDNFPDLFDSDGDSERVTEAIAEVQAMFAGVLTMWARLDATIRAQKRALCMNYLLGWYLANRYPLESVNVAGTGGVPLTSKSIGGVSLAMKDLESQPGMKQLESNSFGILALQMISAAPERFGLYG